MRCLELSEPHIRPWLKLRESKIGKHPLGTLDLGTSYQQNFQQLPGGSVSPDVPGDPVRALSGSWAQGFPVFLISLIIGKCFHSAYIL